MKQTDVLPLGAQRLERVIDAHPTNSLGSREEGPYCGESQKWLQKGNRILPSRALKNEWDFNG